jgi:hypothetical protein
VISAVGDGERAIHGVDAGVLDTPTHLDDRRWVHTVGVAIIRGGGHEERALIDGPCPAPVAAAGYAENTDSAAKMRTEKQDRLSVDDRGAGVVDGDDLHTRVSPHRVDVTSGEDGIRGMTHERLVQRHHERTGTYVDGAFHERAPLPRVSGKLGRRRFLT